MKTNRVASVFLSIAFAVSAFLSLGRSFSYAETANAADYAEAQFSSKGFGAPGLLTDDNQRTYTKANNGGSISVHSDKGIASLYVVFQNPPEPWTLSDGSGKNVTCGENKFIHEFVDVKERLGAVSKDITLTFDKTVTIDEVYAFSEGELPEWVQIWNPPCEKADIMLLSAHADDEQLFFAGTLPYYAGELGLAVQVVYFTNHFASGVRQHEELDGLWTVGVRSYPVMSEFPDVYSENLEQALNGYKYYGYEYEDLAGFVVDEIRRFKPLVVISHDVNGEYGHGTHMLCSKLAKEAADTAAKPEYRPESAQQYGAWQPQKTYIHCHPENKITMNWDIPLERFGGKTAFQMSQLGYQQHKSQHIFPGLLQWLNGKNNNITKASQIRAYSPCDFGLYKTTVGADVKGGDFLENVKTYEQQAIEEEERRKAEEEARLKAEEEARLKAEEEARLKAEEEARLKAEEEARQKAEQERADKQRKQIIFISAGGVLLVIAVVVTVILIRKKRR